MGMARSTNRRDIPPGLARRSAGPPDPAVQQRAWSALVLGVLGPLGLTLNGSNLHRGIYVFAVSLIVGVLAAWLGITSMRQARLAGTLRPRGAVLATVLGFLGLGVSAIALLSFAMFWPQFNQLSNCMAGANTVSAQQACENQFSNSVGGKVGILPGT